MKYCGQCGQEWSDGFQYCPNDATSLQATPPDPLIGQLLGNKYEILLRLGRGPHGTVYRARHRIADQPCAVKLLTSELTEQDGQLKQLRTAVRIGLELRSPHTVRLYDFDYAEEVGYFLVEEFVEGNSLQALLQNRGPLPAQTCASLLLQVAESITEAHEHGLIHGHLTSANILVAGDPAELTAKVSDYGLVDLKPRSQTAGSPSAATDLLYIGGLLFEMLTGEEAFTIASDDDHKLRPTEELQTALRRLQAPDMLAELSLGLLGVSPYRQASSASEVASMLREISAALALREPEAVSAAPSPAQPGEKSLFAGVPRWWSADASPVSEREELPPTEESRLSLLRVGIFLGLVALLGLLVFWLWSERPTLQPQIATSSAPGTAALLPPAFDYEITNRPNEGDPVNHPHVLIRVGRLPLYIIRDKGSYASTVDRAQAVTEALEKAAENLRSNPNFRFTLAVHDGKPTIVQNGSSESGEVLIITITRADVYAYNVRSHEKTTQTELAEWWLARTRDYMDLFVLANPPRLTTRTEDGAALARLYEIARVRSASGSQPGATSLQQALTELDPKLREALQSGVFQFPETHTR